MKPATLELATKQKVIECNGMLMGYSESANSEYIRVFDNWVNRIVMDYPLRFRERAISPPFAPRSKARCRALPTLRGIPRGCRR